ncbi:MAG: lipid-A-disaccharide synthase [Bacteroidota bacterium]
MKYYLIAGEASGDLHGSNLMKALKRVDKSAQFHCWGGDLMAEAGGELVKHYNSLAFMGFWEVVKNLRTISKNLTFCQRDITAYQPDVLILIDYSGFNLRIAKWAKSTGMKVFYYIAPQVWASRQSRVQQIKKYVDRLFVILPFEKTFYQKFDVTVDFVGHPLLDAIAERQQRSTPLLLNSSKPIIALLPGSRKQEIATVLPLFLTTVRRFPAYQFVIAAAPAIPFSFYEKIIKSASLEKEAIEIVADQTYPLLETSEAALVTSGTATLETALFEVPQVVCYKGNWLTYQIAKRLIKVPYISLVNLIANREVVTELIQNDLTTTNLTLELQRILQPSEAKKMITAYQQLKVQLGEVGASDRAAQRMFQYLQETN